MVYINHHSLNSIIMLKILEKSFRIGAFTLGGIALFSFGTWVALDAEGTKPFPVWKMVVTADTAIASMAVTAVAAIAFAVGLAITLAFSKKEQKVRFS